MMKKTAIAALLLSGMALTPALAQNCTSPTRCDELGYSMSKDDCDGLVSLTCPFDNSKLFCLNQAKCDELGYTKSAADCAGTESVSCPFDSSKYFCHDKDDCDKLGYTKSAEACNGLESLVCPSDNSKYFCILKEKPGMIYYSDGTFSYDLEDEKTPVGIIAYIKNDSKLLISLEENNLEFSTGYEDVPCLENHGSDDLAGALADFNGKENTLCMVNYEGKYEYPAAEWCNGFSASDNGIGSSGWYLPAAGELYAMIDNYDAINDGLRRADKKQLCTGYCTYRPSTEGDFGSLWHINLDWGSTKYTYKVGAGEIRCVLAY